MSRSAVRDVLAGLGVLTCVTVALAGQRQTQPPAAAPAAAAAQPPSSLAGSWEFDDDQSKEDQRNWRRPVGAPRPFPTQPTGGGFPGGGGGYPGGGYGGGSGGVVPPLGGGQSGGYLPRPTSSTFETELRRALRDLLEVAESFEIALKGDQVVITDDLDRTFTYTTDGRKEKYRVGATDFAAKTSWDGAMLKQDIEAIGGFHMTQVFLPTEDGQGMFISIRVDKPAFTPPIKPITRTYRRAS